MSRKNIRIERGNTRFIKTSKQKDLEEIPSNTELTEIEPSSSSSTSRRQSDRTSTIYSTINSNLPYPKQMHVSRSRIAIGERLFENIMHGYIHRGSVYKIVPHEWKSTVFIKQLDGKVPYYNTCTIPTYGFTSMLLLRFLTYISLITAVFILDIDMQMMPPFNNKLHYMMN